MSKKKKKPEGKKKVEQVVKEMENQEETLEQESPEAEVQAETESIETETENPEEMPGETEQETQAADTEPDDAEPNPPEKKERKLKWARKEDPAEEKLKEANDRYARLFAEFDNFRKRSEKEKAQRYDFGAKDMVERILPVIDNFERGLKAVPEEQAEDSFVKGMEMTYKQLLKTLEDAGVTQIEAVGKEFNPDFHNAVMHVEDPEAGENIIVEEFQKGYLYKEHVVRYSMVKVAN